MTNESEFLEKIELTVADLNEAQIEVKSLRDIFDDYENQRPQLLDEGEHIQRFLGHLPGVHSTRVRVKSSISLAGKIVRKRKENP